MRQAFPFDFAPVHGDVFDVAEAAFFEVEGAQDAIDLRRLGECRGQRRRARMKESRRMVR